MTGRILIVDDDRAVVDLLCEVLGPHHTTVGETDPKVAIARALVEDFDIVITDVEMPGLRGPELLAQVLAGKPNQLVLMITAFKSSRGDSPVARKGVKKAEEGLGLIVGQ